MRLAKGILILILIISIMAFGTGAYWVGTRVLSGTPTDMTGVVIGTGSTLTVDTDLTFSGNTTTMTVANIGTANIGGGTSTNLTLTTPSGFVATSQYSAGKYTATVNVTWSNGNVQYLVLASGASTLVFAGPADGARYALLLRQPASGAAGTVTWPATVLWPSATAPTLSTTNNVTDICTFIYDGTNTKYYGGASLNYAP